MFSEKVIEEKEAGRRTNIVTSQQKARPALATQQAATLAPYWSVLVSRRSKGWTLRPLGPVLLSNQVLVVLVVKTLFIYRNRL